MTRRILPSIHPTIKWIFFLSLLLVLLLTSPVLSSSPDETLKPVHTFEGGELYQIQELPVLKLYGTYHEMGRQEGHLLKDNLWRYYKTSVTENLLKNKTTDISPVFQETNPYFQKYPKRFQEIIKGMSETSGLSLEQLIVLSQVPIISSMCSGFASFGPYSSDNSMIFGRNADFFSQSPDYSNEIVVLFYNPTDGSNSVATVARPAQIEIATGLNSDGIFYEWNDGSPSGGTLFYPGRRPFISEWLFDYSSLDSLDTAIASTLTNWPAIVNVANSTTAYSYEWATFDQKKRSPDKDGLLVATNHFILPEWGIAGPYGDPYYTVTRRENLLQLGEKYKGRINSDIMQEILDTDLDHGGATGPFTRQQIIVKPETKEIWVKIPHYSDWTYIPGDVFFVPDTGSGNTSETR